jgi:aminoglycoside 3-N-acetyltransferase
VREDSQAGRRKPTLIRLLGRDFPALYELQLRAREKAAIIARRHRGAVVHTPPRQAQRAKAVPLAEGVFAKALAELGVEAGDNLTIHSSWDGCGRLAASPVAVIRELRVAVGGAGTLCMPASPRGGVFRENAFDVRRSPSESGLLSEVFRRLPDTRRSLQQRSVAAQGPMAAELTREHHLSPFASGLESPYGKLATLGGKVLFLGVGAETNTMFHCGEDILREQFPVQVYPSEPRTFRALDADGSAHVVSTYVRAARWTYCCDAVRMLPYFADLITSRSLDGVQLSLIDAGAFLERLLALARIRVHMYGFRFPSPSRAA